MCKIACADGATTIITTIKIRNKFENSVRKIGLKIRFKRGSYWEGFNMWREGIPKFWEGKKVDHHMF